MPAESWGTVTVAQTWCVFDYGTVPTVWRPSHLPLVTRPYGLVVCLSATPSAVQTVPRTRHTIDSDHIFTEYQVYLEAAFRRSAGSSHGEVKPVRICCCGVLFPPSLCSPLGNVRTAVEAAAVVEEYQKAGKCVNNNALIVSGGLVWIPHLAPQQLLRANVSLQPVFLWFVCVQVGSNEGPRAGGS